MWNRAAWQTKSPLTWTVFEVNLLFCRTWPYIEDISSAAYRWFDILPVRFNTNCRADNEKAAIIDSGGYLFSLRSAKPLERQEYHSELLLGYSLGQVHTFREASLGKQNEYFLNVLKVPLLLRFITKPRFKDVGQCIIETAPKEGSGNHWPWERS